MSNSFKYFVSGLDSINDIRNLRKMFPGKYFKNGNHKGKRGVFVLCDLQTREYGEREESCMTNYFKDKGLISHSCELYFWPPSCEVDEFNYDEYYQDRSPIPYIPVNLKCGKQIKINPAVGEPKPLLFGDFKEERLPFACLYSQSTEYGKKAYQLIYKEDELNESGGLKLNDPDVNELFKLSLVNSYDMPLDIWNWLKIISAEDIKDLYTAAMGSNSSFLESVGQL